MKNLKKSLLSGILLLLMPVLFFTGCDDSELDNTSQSSVSYGFAQVNYHYEYGVLIEHYWRESYTIQSGKAYSIETLYTPPIKIGYTFLGWTLQSGGSGDIIPTPFEITGSGFGGTIYDLYAKYEPIEYTIVYHLDEGTNNPNNPTTLTGTKRLLDPTKENFTFEGWYTDAEFLNPILVVSMSDNEITTVEVYAKWSAI
jgi:uncharacterized repeat protein (TIGR02543 family)